MLSGDEALPTKTYSTHIYQCLGLAVTDLIKILKCVYAYWSVWLFPTNIETCSHFQRICNNISALQQISIYLMITKYTPPMTSSKFWKPNHGVYTTQNGNGYRYASSLGVSIFEMHYVDLKHGIYLWCSEKSSCDVSSKFVDSLGPSDAYICASKLTIIGSYNGL